MNEFVTRSESRNVTAHGIFNRIMLLAVSTLSVSMLSGCSLLKPTASSLLKTCNKKMAKVNDMGLDAEMEFAMELGKDGASVDLDFTADMDLAYEKVKDGYETYMDADMEISLMGTSQSAKGEVYTVADKESVTTYTKSEGQDDWVKEVEKADDSKSGLQNIANADFTALAKDMTLMEETKEVHGRECYVLTGVVEDTDLSDVLGTMDMEDIEDIDSLKAEITLNLDKKDKMPVSMIMEIDEDDFNKILEKADLDGVSISVDSFKLELIYKEINTGKTVDIPDEAYDAEEKDDSDDGLNIFGDISDDEDTPADDDEDKPADDDEDKPADDDEDKPADDDEDKPADDDEDKPAKDDEEDEDSDDDDSDDDDSYSFGQGTMSLKEFKNQGFQFEEYVQEEEEAIYLKITNENKKAVSVTVYASFMKDGEVAYDSLNCLDFEPTTFQVADFNIKGDYDSIEYTFEIEECDKDLIGSEMDVFYAIDDETVSGTVTNESSETAKFVEVHVVFYDDNGDIMEHNYTYVDADELAPGEKSDYSMYIYHPSKTNYDIYANCYTD